MQYVIIDEYLYEYLTSDKKFNLTIFNRVNIDKFSFKEYQYNYEFNIKTLHTNHIIMKIHGRDDIIHIFNFLNSNRVKRFLDKTLVDDYIILNKSDKLPFRTKPAIWHKGKLYTDINHYAIIKQHKLENDLECLIGDYYENSTLSIDLTNSMTYSYTVIKRPLFVIVNNSFVDLIDTCKKSLELLNIEVKLDLSQRMVDKEFLSSKEPFK